MATNIPKKNRPLCIFLSKISAYKRDFNETKYISFLIKDDELLEKYNEIWGKVKNSIKSESDSESVYNEKFLIFFFLYIKMRTKYYQNHKEKLRKEARERYQNLSEK